MQQRAKVSNQKRRKQACHFTKSETNLPSVIIYDEHKQQYVDAPADFPVMEAPETRIRCDDCKYLSGGICQVAVKRQKVVAGGGSVSGDFPRHQYRPVLSKLRNCEFGVKK